MKTYKKNEIKEHSFFYIGIDTNRRKNAQGKGGTSQQEYISKRIGKIRQTEPGFMWVVYIDIPDLTKNKIEALEKHVMSIIEDEYQSVGNDPFTFAVNKEIRINQYMTFVIKFLNLATEYCDWRGWSYKTKWNEKFFKKYGWRV